MKLWANWIRELVQPPPRRPPPGVAPPRPCTSPGNTPAASAPSGRAVQAENKKKSKVEKPGFRQHFIGSRVSNQALSSYGSQLDLTCTAVPPSPPPARAPPRLAGSTQSLPARLYYSWCYSRIRRRSSAASRLRRKPIQSQLGLPPPSRHPPPPPPPRRRLGCYRRRMRRRCGAPSPTTLSCSAPRIVQTAGGWGTRAVNPGGSARAGQRNSGSRRCIRGPDTRRTTHPRRPARRVGTFHQFFGKVLAKFW
jgi:hypothetical protein